MVTRSIARALHRWLAWRAQRRLYAAIPSLRDLDARQALQARQHGPVRALEVERRRLVTERLALECGRR